MKTKKGVIVVKNANEELVEDAVKGKIPPDECLEIMEEVLLKEAPVKVEDELLIEPLPKPEVINPEISDVQALFSEKGGSEGFFHGKTSLSP